MENKTLYKNPIKNKKHAMLVQDLNYARNLAANDENLRRRSLKHLKNYLIQRSKLNLLNEETLKILWKGLFFSMWMSDKPLVQEECAENITQLIHCLRFDEAMQFFKIGLETLQNEWIGIDQLRLDKFLMFSRRLLRQTLFALKKINFKKQHNKKFAQILEETILASSAPLSLVMHLIEVFLEELAKVSDGKLHSSRTLDFLEPFINILGFTNDNRVIQWINKFIFTNLMKQHKLGLEYEVKYKVWKAQGFAGSIKQIHKVKCPYNETQEQNLDHESEIFIQNKPLDPRAGRVDVELPQILFNAKDISEAFLIPRADLKTTKRTRNHLILWSEKFLKLYNGIYPLGINILEPKKRKYEDIDTNINKAAKRLIKFEQKIMSWDVENRRMKRGNLEHSSDVKLKEAKRSQNIYNYSKKRETKNFKTHQKEALKKKKNVTFFPNQHKIFDLALNKFEKRVILKNKLRTYKLKQNNTNYAVDNFSFKRNSGIWHVTPAFDDKSESIQQSKNDTKKINKNENKISFPTKNLKKLKKIRNVCGNQSFNRLREKSWASSGTVSYIKSTNNEVFIKKNQVSPKKVVINTKLNVSQDMDDHIMQVISSPQVPWDKSKKPGKPLLKIPTKPSPINPFYTLKAF